MKTRTVGTATAPAHMTSNVYTLPSPPRNSGTAIASSAMINDSSYEEFRNAANKSNKNNNSPSIPWLVEYWWSSSFLRAPAMIIDQMCSCSSAAYVPTDGSGRSDYSSSTSNILMMSSSNNNDNNNGNSSKVHQLDEHHRINLNDPSDRYFDDVIIASRQAPAFVPAKKGKSRSDRKPTKRNRVKNHFHRKTKSLTDRLDQMRAMVASHDESISYDYYEDVLHSASLDHDNSRCNPSASKKLQHLTNYRRSSIVVDTDDEDDFEEFEKAEEEGRLHHHNTTYHFNDNDDDDYEEDEIRISPPLSPSPTEGSQASNSVNRTFRTNNSNNNKIGLNNSNNHQRCIMQQGHEICNANTESSFQYMDLNTCQSFDQYIDTTKYLCANSESEHMAAASSVSTPPPTRPRITTPPPPPPRRRSHRRHRSYNSIRPSSPLSSPVSPTTTASTTDSGPPSSSTFTPDDDTITPLPTRLNAAFDRAVDAASSSTTAGGTSVSRTRTPPSPAQSTGADTYTTISLSQSYERDFEEYEERERELDLKSSESAAANAAVAAAVAAADAATAEAVPPPTSPITSAATAVTSSTAAGTNTTISATTSSSSSFEDDIKNGNLFLDRLASEQLLRETRIPSSSPTLSSPPPSTTTPARPTPSTSDSRSTNRTSTTKGKKTIGGSPFRRLRPRQTTTKVSSPEKEEEGIEQTLVAHDESLYPTKQSSMTVKNLEIDNDEEEEVEEVGDRSSSHSSRSSSHNNNNANPAYRYLIRMNPRNYKHGSQSSMISLLSSASSRSLNANGTNGGEEDDPAVVETCSSPIKVRQQRPDPPRPDPPVTDGYIHHHQPNEENNNGLSSSFTPTIMTKPSSSAFSNLQSVLLPLHPHQRIIAPLPQNDSTFDDDNSGYTYFRDTLHRTRVCDIQRIEAMQQQWEELENQESSQSQSVLSPPQPRREPHPLFPQL